MKHTKISQIILSIALIVLVTWVLGMVFKLAAWLINGLLYVAAVVVIIWLITLFIESKRGH